VIAYYNAVDTRVNVFDASQFTFVKSSGNGPMLYGRKVLLNGEHCKFVKFDERSAGKGAKMLYGCVNGVATYQIYFVNEEDRNHMIKELDWFSKNGEPGYAAVLINYASDWWLDDVGV
jgi:hypothetical protein